MAAVVLHDGTIHLLGRALGLHIFHENVTSHHRHRLPSIIYKYDCLTFAHLPLFRPCPRSKARWGLHWALVGAHSNPREYQLLSQQNVNGQKLQATIGISWMQLLENYCSPWKSAQRYCAWCFSMLFLYILYSTALQHAFLFTPTVGSVWDM